MNICITTENPEILFPCSQKGARSTTNHRKQKSLPVYYCDVKYISNFVRIFFAAVSEYLVIANTIFTLILYNEISLTQFLHPYVWENHNQIKL